MKTGRKPTCACGECRKCRQRVAARERYRKLSLEERRALIARRDPEKVRGNDRARYERDKAKRRAIYDAYVQTPEGQTARERARERWDMDNPEKKRAHTTVGNAIRDGRLVRQPCEVCGATGVEAHHDDYSKPLDVRWLCVRHHAEHHKAERAAIREAA